jgi:hypothetical protein
MCVLEEGRMKKYILVAIAAALASSGCSGMVAKNFKVFADPPDSTIRVVSGVELKERLYRSPATVTAEVPKDPALAAKAVLEVSKDNYQQKTMSLRDINDGDTLNIKLEKILRDIVRYKLSFRLVSPLVSKELRFHDKNLSVSFVVGEQGFEMHFENLSPHDVKILWDRAEYTDVSRQTQRLMHSGIRFPDRNNPIPDQYVLSLSSVQETVIPISNVYTLPKRKGYDIHPLFTLESDVAAGLKGKAVILFIPVEINRQIIPYNFKIEITDSVKESIKG